MIRISHAQITGLGHSMAEDFLWPFWLLYVMIRWIRYAIHLLIGILLCYAAGWIIDTIENCRAYAQQRERRTARVLMEYLLR